MPEPLTADRLAEIKARAENATPAPWHDDDSHPGAEGYLAVWAGGRGDPDQVRYIAGFGDLEETIGQDHHDAEFVAHARQDVEDLVAEVERLTGGALAHIAPEVMRATPLSERATQLLGAFMGAFATDSSKEHRATCYILLSGYLSELEQQVEQLRRPDRDVAEALNSGDGVYRP